MRKAGAYWDARGGLRVDLALALAELTCGGPLLFAAGLDLAARATERREWLAGLRNALDAYLREM